MGPSHLQLYRGGQLIPMQEIEKLRKDLKEKAREKEEALAQLQSQRPVCAHDTPHSPWRNIAPP